MIEQTCYMVDRNGKQRKEKEKRKKIDDQLRPYRGRCMDTIFFFFLFHFY